MTGSEVNRLHRSDSGYDLVGESVRSPSRSSMTPREVPSQTSSLDATTNESSKIENNQRAMDKVSRAFRLGVLKAGPLLLGVALLTFQCNRCDRGAS